MNNEERVKWAQEWNTNLFVFVNDGNGNEMPTNCPDWCTYYGMYDKIIGKLFICDIRQG